jgi:predicted ATPase
VAKYSAIQLFLQNARRIRPDFRLTDDNAPAISQICRLMEGMPLGILLAAAWIELLTPQEIVEEINRSLDFLATDLRDLPERQRSLRAVFDHSWRLLAEKEQAVFQQLSVFRGGFSREAAETVTGASLQTLLALVHKSLLHRAAEGRYEIHELLRQYAAEKLDEQTFQVSETWKVSEARDRHSAYYCAFLHQHEADLKGPRQQAALSEIEADSENARVAWQWAVERGQVEYLGQAIDSLGLFHLWRGRLYEGEAMCRMAAEKLAESMPLTPERTRILVKILTWQCNFSRRLGQADPAQQLLQQALSLLDSPREISREG